MTNIERENKMTRIKEQPLKLIPQIKQELEAGKVVILPTDTVYILVANGLKSEAINKIYQLKKWNNPQPLILLTNEQKVDQFGVVNPDTKILIRQFPYPITLILPHRGNLPDSITAGYKTIFISCPNDLINLLIEDLPFPLVCATASLGADYKAKNFPTAMQLFGEQVSLIVDGGKCKYNNQNTKIDCSLSIPTILNFGVISFDDLRLILPTIELPSHLRK